MVSKLLFWLSGRLKCRIIGVDGDPYLERYSVYSSKQLKVHLHRFIREDADRFVHDHPWNWAFAIVLSGGYTEERLTGLDIDEGYKLKKRRMFPLRINLIRGTSFHRITTTRPETWTLFVHGPKTKSWGFLKKGEDDGRPVVIYHQPMDVSTSKNWEDKVAIGTLSNRAPYQS